MRGVGLFISPLMVCCAACSAPPPAPAPASPAPTPVRQTPPEPERVPPVPAPGLAGVVPTVADAPPKREPTFDDVLKLQKEVAARRSSSDDEKLRLALLQAAAGNLEESERVLSTVKTRSHRLVPYLELYLRRQLGDHEEAGKLLARLDEEGRTLAGFGIERAELVRRVRRYRDYVPAESSGVAPGGELHLYVEPRNFASQASGDRQAFHLRYEWKLMDEHSAVLPVPAWDEAPAEAREDKISSNGPVAEFYQSFRLPLPLNLAAGHYRVRVT
ncbi:MAG TPA: hypothetical protein VKW04_20995, partial [Planctomycetota bacterium]|nr:hypothetical protein [Planctomycetota bacterium]